METCKKAEIAAFKRGKALGMLEVKFHLGVPFLPYTRFHISDKEYIRDLCKLYGYVPLMNIRESKNTLVASFELYVFNDN